MRVSCCGRSDEMETATSHIWKRDASPVKTDNGLSAYVCVCVWKDASRMINNNHISLSGLEFAMCDDDELGISGVSV